MNAPFDSKPISQNPLFLTTCLTPPFDMSTAYRQTNFRDRPEYALSPRVAAETPNGVPGRPMNPHTSCDGGDSGASAYWRATIPRHLFSLLAFRLDTAMRRNQTACRMTGDGLRSDYELGIWESMLQYPVLLPPSYSSCDAPTSMRNQIYQQVHTIGALLNEKLSLPSHRSL
jgi:hypothetical protein